MKIWLTFVDYFKITTPNPFFVNAKTKTALVKEAYERVFKHLKSGNKNTVYEVLKYLDNEDLRYDHIRIKVTDLTPQVYINGKEDMDRLVSEFRREG